ncbi:methyltransferase protein 6-like [Tropilaelaps mercedesae]|uniref:Methyltransferase protein 6-like n=1 Tax=Tropilaelaps mercedesae TaxID=418985 RepID=A0A1V9X9E9_9ACAR|nr:methyltransferase protein 6-like [Tropilaelaps mercedesae]
MSAHLNSEDPVRLGHKARTLSPDEVKKLTEDRELVSEFKQNKLELEAKKHWDKFYLRNETRFFKDRHWTTREFEELLGLYWEPGHTGNGSAPADKSRPVLLEVVACDFSPRAVALLAANPTFVAQGGRAFVCDLTTPMLFEEMRPNSVDVATMIFMLSAVHPDKMPLVISNIFKVVRPGGVVLFRDYGLYDQAQLRFKKGHKLQENFYVRQDGTRAFYFSEEATRGLFEKAGFSTKENSYVCRSTVNRKENIDVPRVFVQGKFVKPFEQAGALVNTLGSADAPGEEREMRSSDLTSVAVSASSSIESTLDS